LFSEVLDSASHDWQWITDSISRPDKQHRGLHPKFYGDMMVPATCAQQL